MLILYILTFQRGLLWANTKFGERWKVYSGACWVSLWVDNDEVVTCVTMNTRRGHFDFKIEAAFSYI